MKRTWKAIAAIMLIVAAIIVAGCNKPDEPNNGGNNGGGNNGNNDSDVRVTTYTPQDITATTAKCGGDVIVAQGLSLTELGVCYGKEHDPTVDQTHLSTTVWYNPFVCTITNLVPNTKYYVRAYALRGLEYYYGEEKEFVSAANNDNHEYVDLGLPSGTLWASCNLGAESPEDYGNYYAWGENVPKSTYDWNTYGYCNSSSDMLTKYCFNSDYGYNGYIDNLTILQSTDDAATVNWGADWRMPTSDEWQELRNNTESTWATRNGVKGMYYTANNGNRIFLPANGFLAYGHLYEEGVYGYYWSSTLGSNDPRRAVSFSFSEGNRMPNRFQGQTVRPVRSE